jgi:hypothetical protein
VDGVAIPAGWWNPAYHARQLVTVDNTGVAAALDSFPVLVPLAGSSTDVRFIAADGTTVLAYDVDDVDGATASFWVPVTIPPAGSAKPTFWAYSDDVGGGGPAPDGSAVWSAFVSVHHMGGTFVDATGNGHDGTPTDAATTPVPAIGVFGTASMFDGSADAVPLATTSAYDLVSGLSVSAWVKLSAWEIGFECIVCKGDSAWRLHRGNTDSKPDFGSTPAAQGTAGNANLDAGTNVDDDQWHLVAMEFDGSTKVISVDGSGVETAASTALATNAFQVVIGENAEAVSPSFRYFEGLMDEVRIAPAPLGSAWFATEYRAGTEAGFVAVGSAQRIE